MISFIVIMIAAPAIVIYALVKAVVDTKRGVKPQPPTPKDPIDKHMDDNYADIDWLRKGKL